MLAALLLASACSSSTVSFGPDPEPTAGNGSGGSESEAGKSNGASGSGNNAGSSALGGSGNEGGASGGSDSGGTESGGSESEGGSAGSGGTAMGGSGTAGEPTAGSGGSVSGGSGGDGGTAGSGGTNGGSGGTGEGGSGGYNGEPCTPGFYGGHSYQFCGAVDSALAAYTKCQGLGMGVVSIESKAENTYVQGKQGTTWLGGTDETMEGEWRWVSTQVLFWNEKPVAGVYQNFIDGQPSNKDNMGNPENCLLLSASGWNDVGCALSGFKVTCESSGPVGPIEP